MRTDTTEEGERRCIVALCDVVGYGKTIAWAAHEWYSKTEQPRIAGWLRALADEVELAASVESGA